MPRRVRTIVTVVLTPLTVAQMVITSASASLPTVAVETETEFMRKRLRKIRPFSSLCLCRESRGACSL
ncbi:MAG: hypothetical protein Q8L46_00510, partial [candidate division WWE3 bacterium]|nr:hypothetical protein [candidate division WWE3 bacterium]